MWPAQVMFIFCCNYTEKAEQRTERDEGVMENQKKGGGKEIGREDERHEGERSEGRRKRKQIILVILFEVRDSWETESVNLILKITFCYIT